MGHTKEVQIVLIPVWERVSLQFLSCVFGVWVLFKRLAKWVWNPSAFAQITRDKPPSCLVDTSLGQHKYVKLKKYSRSSVCGLAAWLYHLWAMHAWLLVKNLFWTDSSLSANFKTGVKLHYVESGPKHQPLILLLHGFPDCWLSWRYQIPVLSMHFRVVALDLKGFGDSDKPSWSRNYKIPTILEELRQFIVSLGVKNCTIIGHDLGALLGWYMVHKHPDIVDKFVSVSCPHPNVYWQSVSPQSVFNRNWISFAQLPHLPEIDALKDDLNIIQKCHSHLQEKDSQEDGYLEAYKYAFSRSEDWNGPINYYRNLPFYRVNEECEPVTVSTLLITGNKDNSIKLESVVRSTEFVEKFYVKIIDGAGHFPHQENPDMFNKNVLKFLRVRSLSERNLERTPSKGLMDRMLGAVSNTVKYGNSMIDSVQKRTNGVVNSIPNLGLNYNNNNAQAVVQD